MLRLSRWLPSGIVRGGGLAAATVTFVALAACGSSSTSSSSASAAAPSLPVATPTATSAASATSTDSRATPSSAPVVAATVAMGTTGAGPALTDSAGLTLYYFMPEKGTKIACTGACTQTWPPLTVAGASALGTPSGLAGVLSTVARPEGTTQVTYNGWPLYKFASDKAPGDAKGQGVGGKWFIAGPSVAPA